MYTGQVISMRQDLAAILKRPNGLYLSDEMVKKYLENNKKKVKVFKITLPTSPVSQVNRPLIGGKRTHPQLMPKNRKERRLKINSLNCI
jgi:hypothetical protein